MFELLNDLVEQNKKYIKNGHVATYIPALAKINPNQLGIAIIDLQNNNKEYFAGEYDTRFAIESISKVPTLILAALDNGLDTVFENIDTEPTGFAFNSILNMEINHRNKPTNPFVNAGAITTTSLVKAATTEERSNRILEFFKKITNDPDIRLNEEIYLSEKKTGDINRSLAYYLKGNNMIKGEISEVLDSYFKQCSLEVNALSLARLGAVLANNGVLPWNNEKLVSKEISTIVKSLMVTCGLYDESGTFGVHIGIPAKSGVGGGILAVVPKRYGIGIFSPALDKKGNSVAGMHLLQDLSQKFDLNIFE
ncbi:glutaminase A [Eubacterium multiforme]|uniref:Glutaminase n=1 Tax=Eubacterium multiforme TaxID=83339 RepID=A0ABT9UPY5_9FIRM|nr:glutaminase A [Eubacterium multiforme]MDQ0148719.1 glutaminase [Eubacterium multiforme]